MKARNEKRLCEARGILVGLSYVAEKSVAEAIQIAIDLLDEIELEETKDENANE